MKAVILDMFGVILKQTGEEFGALSVTDINRIMELGPLWCQSPVSGYVAHCSITFSFLLGLY